MLTRILVAVLLLSSVNSLHAREWTDSSGKYKLEAELIGFDGTEVILQRKDGELGALPIAKLSKADQAFLESKEAKEIHTSNIGETQVWHLDNGIKISGRIVDFAQREVVVQARRGKTYVNNIVFENLPQIYQYMLPMIVQHLEPVGQIDKQGFKTWVRSLKGNAKKFELSGVLFELENGDEYGVPFFLFTKDDQKLLRPGWEMWLKEKAEAEKADQHAFLLQTQLAAYKRQAEQAEKSEREQAFQRQIAVLNLQFQAINSGVTSAWEVTLYPRPGNPQRPRWVVAYGQNSLVATQNALKANPGFRDGPVRKLSY